MVGSKSLKATLIISMVSVSLLTAGAVGGVAIVKSNELVAHYAKDVMQIKSNTIAESVYDNFKAVEKNVHLMAGFVASYSGIRSVADLQTLRQKTVGEQAYARVRSFPNAIGANTPWCLSTYFYFDQTYFPQYDGAWYVKNKQGVFVRQLSNMPIVEKDGDWYYKPIQFKKGRWAKPYIDDAIHVKMISYSEPVYKNGLLLGVAGMDIELADLDKFVKDIHVFPNTNAFMVDDAFNFIVGDTLKTGENLLEVNNGQYQFLADAMGTKQSGYVEYKGKTETKIVSFSRLPNGFFLIMDVPLAAVLAEMNQLMGLLLSILGIGTVVAFGVSVSIGSAISNKISKASKEIAVGSEQMMQACTEGVERSAVISQDATQMAHTITEEMESVNDCVVNIASMSSTMETIINNTNTVVNLAKNSAANAMLGNTLAVKSVATMDTIKQVTTATATKTEALNILVAKLGTIVALIKSIVEQTNLLALNATIEAVRAGEQGQGFYIVAGEVKNLATQSAEATVDVTQLIQQIQAELHNVTDTIHYSTGVVEEGVTLIKDVGNNLQEILTAANQVTAQSEEVSALLADSVINPEKLLATMRNISGAIQQSAKSTQHMASVTQAQTADIEKINENSQALSFTAQQLEALVTTFTL